MSCQHYEKELEAAAGGELNRQSAAHLGAHLVSCAACRLEFESKKLVYEAVDKGLIRRVNEDLPHGFAMRVRARVNANREGAHNNTGMAWASVGIAAVMLIAFFLMPDLRLERDRSSVEQAIGQDKQQATGRLGTTRENTVSNVPGAPKSLVRRTETEVTRASVTGPSRKFSDPQVLVPADQKQAVTRLIEGLRVGDVKGEVLSVLGGDHSQELSITPLSIPPIELNPLEEGRLELDRSSQ